MKRSVNVTHKGSVGRKTVRFEIEFEVIEMTGRGQNILEYLIGYAGGGPKKRIEAARITGTGNTKIRSARSGRGVPIGETAGFKAAILKQIAATALQSDGVAFAEPVPTANKVAIANAIFFICPPLPAVWQRVIRALSVCHEHFAIFVPK
jgi:hypothetical protein